MDKILVKTCLLLTVSSASFCTFSEFDAIFDSPSMANCLKSADNPLEFDQCYDLIGLSTDCRACFSDSVLLHKSMERSGNIDFSLLEAELQKCFPHDAEESSTRIPAMLTKSSAIMPIVAVYVIFSLAVRI